MAPDKRVVLLAGEGDSTSIVYNALARDLSWSGVILEAPVPRGEMLHKRARRLGVKRVTGQLAFRGAVVPLLRAASARRVRDILGTYDLDRTPPPALVAHRVSSANASETLRLLETMEPTVVVVNGTRLLSRAVLSCVPATFINAHAGITPCYRGVHGGYWALVEKRRDLCGVTVHLVDPGIDTGGILGQATIAPTPADNFVTYPYLQIAAALPILRAAVEQALAGTLTTIAPPATASKLWSHPTVWEYVRHFIGGVR